MSGYPYSPSQLGVRPSSALSNQLLMGAFTWMFAGLLVTAGTAFLVASNERLIQTIGGLWLPFAFGTLGLSLGLQWLMPRMSALTALVGFFIFAAVIGAMTGVIVSLYTGESVAAAFVSTSAIFGGAALYGATTKRSLIGLGPTLFMAMIGLIAASFVNLFIHATVFGWILSIGIVILFTIFTAYDVQRIGRGDYAAALGSAEKGSVLAALLLYINFINIFWSLLNLLGSRD